MAGHEPKTFANSRRYRWAGYALGFAIGGFFDGILLHQVLQWHHLLSGLEGQRFQDLRFQILADGVFHLAMYAVGGVGLWLLWRTRGHFAAPGADRRLVANALIGFGAWHVIDAVASHWLLGLHRIRMDSETPLIWDLAWFLVFGVLFVAWGWRLHRGGGGGGGGGGRLAPGTVSLVAILSGAAALLPPVQDPDAPTIVMFWPGTTPARAMSAVTDIGGTLVWSDASDQLWGIDLPDSVAPSSLYGRGAMLVSGSWLPAGCLDWFIDPKGA